MIPTLLTGIALVALLVAEKQNSKSRLVFKSLASFGFLWAALPDGRLPLTLAGSLLLVGLGLSFVGDVALVSERGFLIGLVAFAGAHLAYSASFLITGTRLRIIIPATFIALISFLVVTLWLLWRVPDRLRRPVVAYMIIISIMLVTAAGSSNLVIFAGGGLFYLSDLAVARQRFVTPGYNNKLIGLPLYYAAQLLLASTVI